ncbi:D-alanyl-D-alanine carboxypeptidase family protein [Patescibacteria group bacterium]|nr:D-alanyl-D-alanine carboxypeptidase family protein [Patescibacteria group bacterium]MCG2695108.1 D-alanyl-D-alanine carboxypeptidase family protein [Candidatus Parcubacteria bacterium]
MKINNNKEIIISVLIMLTGVLGFFVYKNVSQNKELSQNIKLKEQAVISLEEKLTQTKIELASTTQKLSLVQEEKNILEKEVNDQATKVSDITSQIQNITGAIGTIDKLMKIDPELLKKYSKTFFLSENYFPTNLINIDNQYTLNPEKDLWIKKEIYENLKNLIDGARNSNLNIKVLSAFRSFETQTNLKSIYTVKYGTGANQFSADQGYSEHQLGTAVDFTTPELGEGLVNFENESIYQWLNENAYKYGFTLSYPEDNTYYKFEPWHWRFVGKKLAGKIHNENKNFQDLDQRELDGYLIYIFD